MTHAAAIKINHNLREISYSIFNIRGSTRVCLRPVFSWTDYQQLMVTKFSIIFLKTALLAVHTPCHKSPNHHLSRHILQFFLGYMVHVIPWSMSWICPEVSALWLIYVTVEAPGLHLFHVNNLKYIFPGREKTRSGPLLRREEQELSSKGSVLVVHPTLQSCLKNVLKNPQACLKYLQINGQLYFNRSNSNNLWRGQFNLFICTSESLRINF